MALNKQMTLHVPLVSVLATSFLAAATASLAEARPNVLLIMTDDQGWGDVQAHGNDRIDTPVQDRLFAAGARFDRFYVSPVCAPTRASLLTGRYHLRTHVHGVTRGFENMRANEVTIAELLKKEGYATGCFGKWHNGAQYPMHPNGQGFDEFFGFCAGHWNTYFDTYLETNGVFAKTKGYITDLITERALAFIEKNQHQPFFCYVPYNAPHSPWQLPDEYYDRYIARGFDPATASALGMVESIDDNIGRLLSKLDALALADDTIVLFLTDNGPNTNRYNGDMRGRKGSVHEGGVRVPLFVRYPRRIQANTEVQPIAAHIDILPTLLDLCDVELDESIELDGRSLVPLMTGEPSDWPARSLFTFRRTGELGAVRTQRWRAAKDRRGWELYDMQADPGQKVNLAKQRPKLLAEFQAAYEKKLAEVSAGGFDPLPIPVGYAERPLTRLRGHEAFFHPEVKQGISYYGERGWANDWIANWTDIDAYPFWPVQVNADGQYEISLMYCCPADSVGAKLQVEIGGQRLEGRITEAHDPPPPPLLDRIAKKESFDREWAELKLGQVKLSAGETKLVIRAISKPGRVVGDFKAAHVTRVD